MGRTAVGEIAPRLRELAAGLRSLEALRSQGPGPRRSSQEHVRTLRMRTPAGGEISGTFTLGPGETLVPAAGPTMAAVIGDTAGDEQHRIRIYTADADGVELAHEDAPVSPGVRALGRGFLWVRRDRTLRPHRLLWWHPQSIRPTVLAEEPDPARRLELRSADADTAILASRGAATARHRIITARDGTVPSCRALTPYGVDGDVAVWGRSVVVLERMDGLLRDASSGGVVAEAPPAFCAEHLQVSGGALLVVGRADGRRAVWQSSDGRQAMWTAPPAGTMLPAFDPAKGRLMLLASSPVHRPQVRPAVPGESLALESTGRASALSLSAVGDDGTAIPITLFLPPGDHARPLVVHVYGAYGISLEGPFDPFTDDLLRRGVAVAFCHVRGGGELGPRWHRQGMARFRYRTVEDVLSCVAELRAVPTIAADRILMTAASAGGLTAAAACLRRPTWLRGLHLVHPFIDPLETLMRDGSNLASTDRDEYGDPRDDPEIRDLLRRLSPLAHLQDLPARSRPLPRAWIRAAENDARADNDAILAFSRLYSEVSDRPHSGHVVHRLTPGGHVGGGEADAADDENLLAHAWMLDVLEAA